MLGGNNNNNSNNDSLFPLFVDENGLPYANASNQLQLFGNLPVGCNVDPVNYFANEQKPLANEQKPFANEQKPFANEQKPPLLRPNKRGREGDNNIFRQQKVQISLNYNPFHDEADRSASIPQNQVSTGLKLSYDDDERNSSVTSASGSMTAAPSMMFTIDDNLRSELDRQREELDQYIKVQEEKLLKGLRDINQRQIATILTALDKGVTQKLREREQVIESINQKNRALVDRIKQMATEAQNWHYRAKYNESVVNILKNNLQQAISLGPDQGKEGFGDSEVCDTASYVDPSNYLSLPGGGVGTSSAAPVKGNRICRACKSKEVSVLLMPCRHLCVCKDCDVLINACPVCQLMKTASVQVQLP